jgi:hypothetical protein
MVRYSFLLLLVAVWLSCKKDSVITSPDALLRTSADTLRFDTVFTTVGSITKNLTVVNANDQRMVISSIQLKGGANSPYSINVNGVSGTSFSNLSLNANDSLYIFARVSINPSSSQLPFIVRDSIEITYNGNTRKIQLEAYGQNARFISSGRISTNTTWDNALPYVIVKPLTVADGVTLTITEGTRVYCNANAPLIVNGTLKAMGKFYDSTRIRFRSDRLDGDYKDLPGTWPGIYFNNSSSNNEMNYVDVLNAYQAVLVQGGPSLTPAKLRMNGCVIDNAYDFGLLAFNTSLNVVNSRFTQIGNDGTPGTGGSNIIISGGGNYVFNHCSIATYANFYQNHKQPSMFITNNANGTGQPLTLQMDNSIIYGQGGLTENELVTQKTGTAPFAITMRNVLYKVKTDPTDISFSNSLKNLDPLFDTINTSLRLFNWRLRDGSPCIDAGLPGGPPTDLDGKPRPVGTKPDLGCYEKK